MTFSGHRIDAAVAKAKQVSRNSRDAAIIVHDRRRGFAVVEQSNLADGLRIVGKAIGGRIVHAQ